VSEAEHPDRVGREVTVEDIRAIASAATPHFALQVRNRIGRLIRDLPTDHPAHVEGQAAIARLTALGLLGEVRGHEKDLAPLPSVALEPSALFPEASHE
jgi:hypothetical protein